jgi:branched-chain amino acid transport system permease protein
MGKAMRAVSYDMEAAQLMGISVNKTISFTFFLGSILAGAAGIMVALSWTSIDPYMGMMPGLKAFVSAVLGGIGIIPGALIGGVFIGIAETLTKAYISTSLSDAIAFSILIIVLLVKPTGILGKVESEKV